MQKISITICCLLLVVSSWAQQLSNQTVGSYGRAFSSGNIVLEDHIGSILTSSIASPGFLYTQGFLQPNAGTTTGPVYINDVSLSGSGYGLDNAGKTLSRDNTMLEFTLGEFASITMTNGISTTITQGVLQPYATTGALPVTGLEFFAKRINSTTVQLDWRTLTEINNKGFYAERRKENENSFTSVGFVQSKALGGNSSFALDYQKNDNNNYSGKTYYRIKQEDVNGLVSYSSIRLVNGESNLALQVWPVPAVGFFNVSVNGLAKPDVLQVLDMSGKLVKQFTVQNQTPQKVGGLPAGVYFVRLASDNTLRQKAVVQ